MFHTKLAQGNLRQLQRMVKVIHSFIRTENLDKILCNSSRHYGNDGESCLLVKLSPKREIILGKTKDNSERKFHEEAAI